MKKIGSFIAVICLTLTFIQGCKKDSPAVITPQRATVKMYLTDSTGPYQEVNIDIREVEIHSSGAGWQTFPIVNPAIYNLLNFSNGLDTLILNNTFPAGKISQIRLILGPNNSVKVGGITYPVSTPSAEQSGLKLQIHQDLLAGITYSITLDFDAAKSIIKTGNGTYKLKPVIRTITQGIDGAIRGKIVPAVITPVFAISGSDTIGAFTNNNGDYLIQGLNSGTYTVLITPAAPYTNKSISNVGVVKGVITDAGITNL